LLFFSSFFSGPASSDIRLAPVNDETFDYERVDKNLIQTQAEPLHKSVELSPIQVEVTRLNQPTAITEDELNDVDTVIDFMNRSVSFLVFVFLSPILTLLALSRLPLFVAATSDDQTKPTMAKSPVHLF
jgi:hypothetical protein